MALAATVAACGSDESGSGLSGTIAGAGASSQAAAMRAWIAEFGKQNSGVTVNYDPTGSGAGREQFVSGGVDFAGSDVRIAPVHRSDQSGTTENFTDYLAAAQAAGSAPITDSLRPGCSPR